jgi:2-phospho-L-lactate guanylyltransferase
MKPGMWTIVPMRGIGRGKSRLAPVLNDAERANLNRWLLARTLKAIERWCGDLRSCVVVTSCDGVLEVARRAGAAGVRDARGAKDLNGALMKGLSYAMSHGARRVLVVPCDLPGLTAESLRALACTVHESPTVVLAPDKLGTGTNAMVVDADRHTEFHFGECSLARHSAWAAARGARISLVVRPELAFDLDTPGDFSAWLKHGIERPRTLESNRF